MSSLYKLEDYCLFFLDFMGQCKKLGDSNNVEKEIVKMSNAILYLKETTNIKHIIHRQQFSDTVLIYFKTVDLSRECVNERLNILMGRIGCIFLQCLAYGMPFRGVGLVGKGVELEKNNFYGPVLLEASKLEKTIPQYPRVVLTNSIVNYLDDNSSQRLYIDVDGCHCINPLSDKILEEMKKNAACRFYKNCLDFIEKEKNEHADNLYIRSKYTRLENLFKKFGKNWENQKDE